MSNSVKISPPDAASFPVLSFVPRSQKRQISATFRRPIQGPGHATQRCNSASMRPLLDAGKNQSASPCPKLHAPGSSRAARPAPCATACAPPRRVRHAPGVAARVRIGCLARCRLWVQCRRAAGGQQRDNAAARRAAAVARRGGGGPWCPRRAQHTARSGGAARGAGRRHPKTAHWHCGGARHLLCAPRGARARAARRAGTLD